jgi:hypothetical protein
MEFFLDDPLGQAVATPFVVGAVLTLIVRAAFGPAWGGKLAVAGGAAGFIVGFAVLQGVPTFPPPASVGKIFYLALFGGALGLAVDLLGATRKAGHALAFLLPAAALLWIAERRLGGTLSAGLVANLVVLFLASILVYWRVAATARGADAPENRSAGLFPAILVLVAAAGLALLAVMGASAALSAMSVALAAAAGGHLAVSGLFHLAGRAPFRFDAIGAFGLAGALLAIGYVLVLFNEGASRVALALLLLVFVIDFVARPAALAARPGGGAARLVQPVFYLAIVALPAALAVAYAYLILGQRPG